MYKVGDVITDPEAEEPPEGTVVVDKYGDPFQRQFYWWQAGQRDDFSWRQVLDEPPLTIVWMPGE